MRRRPFIDIAQNVQKDAVIKINVRISKSIRCSTENALFISFEYQNDIMNTIREINSRYYHKNLKEWELPDTELSFIKSRFNKYDLQIIEKVKDKKPVAKMPDGFEFITEPFAHQIVGFNYGLTHDRWLLGDEMGLGKTKQVIDIAVAKYFEKNYQHCLIICGVNGLKWNWQDEIHTHTGTQGWILGQKTNKKGRIVIGSTDEKYEDLMNIDKLPYFIITNIETLRQETITQKLKELCYNKVINMIAFDECHKAKNPTSQQGKGILKVQAETMIAMTGTPLMNNPLDLYIILKWLGYEKHNFYAFKNHFCVLGGFGNYEIVGYKNLDELQNQLSSMMLRRKKDDVLDLPDKLYINEYVEMSRKQAKIYKEVSAEIKANIDKIKISPNLLAQLIRLRQATGYTGILSSTIQESAKLDRLEELVEELIENGKKIVIFSNWTQMTDIINERLCNLNLKCGAITITGETPDAMRQQCINNFQNDPKVKIALGTIGALGTGLTLTASSVVIFVDHPWTMAAYQQAIDRCHRIGQTNNVTIYNLLTKDTIDEKIYHLIQQKGLLSDCIVDGKVVGRKSELLDYLLN